MLRFSLKEPMLFLLGFCVYFALARNSVPFAQSFHPKESLMIAPQIIAWLLLFVLYWNQRLTVSVIVHSAFSVLYLALLGVAIVAGRASTDLILLGAFACAFGTLLSFPTAAATIIIRRIKAERRENAN